MLSQSFSFDANDRLNTDTYDANGNTLIGFGFGQNQPDQYDFENRLVTRHTPSATIYLTYDGDGNRVSKTVVTATNSINTFYVVDELNPSGYAQVLEEHTVINSSSTTLTRAYTYGSDLISQDQWTGAAWTVSFYGYDGHGNVRYLTDTNAAATDTYDYDAFGTLIAHYGATPNNYLYCGEQFDADLGLYYNRARYLNTDSGRFWTKDLFGGIVFDPRTLHQYLYGQSDPVNGQDPTGLVDFTIAGALSAINIDQDNQKRKTDRDIRVYKRTTRNIVCNMGRLGFTSVLAVSGGHHLFPKFAGGARKQILAILSPRVHQMLHDLIYIIARNDPILGELSALGGGANGSTAAWQELLENNPAAQRAAIRVAMRATRIVDKWCGFQYPATLTEELKTVLRNPANYDMDFW
jgi:RHS repeat-associated protein